MHFHQTQLSAFFSAFLPIKFIVAWILAKFETVMVSYSRFLWIKNSSVKRKVWISNLLHAMQLPNILYTIKPNRLDGFGEPELVTLLLGAADLSLGASTLSKVWNCNEAVKLRWLRGGLSNCIACSRFSSQALLWPLEFVVLQNPIISLFHVFSYS